MTMGSPLDKHILLWPGLWKSLTPGLANSLFSSRRIPWRNYYDYGDPVGFKLDSVRAWLKQQKCTAFQFDTKHDHGFARYLLPGEAHNEYWNDPDVFEHFIKEVVSSPGQTFDAPKSKLIISVLSPLIP